MEPTEQKFDDVVRVGGEYIRPGENVLYLIGLDSEQNDGGQALEVENVICVIGPRMSEDRINGIIDSEVASFHRGFNVWAAKEKHDEQEAFPDIDSINWLTTASPEERERWHTFKRIWRADNPLPLYPDDRVVDVLVYRGIYRKVEPVIVKIDYSASKHREDHNE